MSDDLLILLLIVWGASAIAAGMIATDKERNFIAFAVITFLFLGPLGPGVALLATHGAVEKAKLLAARAALDAAANDKGTKASGGRKVVSGRQRFICPRCGADNDIPNADTSYDCWRCSEHRKVKPKVAENK